MRPHKICLCRSVTREQIIAAVRAGARSLPAVQQATLAATGCGTCFPRLYEVFEEAMRIVADEEAGQRRLEQL